MLGMVSMLSTLISTLFTDEVDYEVSHGEG